MQRTRHVNIKWKRSFNILCWLLSFINSATQQLADNFQSEVFVPACVKCLFSYSRWLFKPRCLFCEQHFSVSLIENAVTFFRKLRCSIDPSQRRRVLLQYHSPPSFSSTQTFPLRLSLQTASHWRALSQISTKLSPQSQEVLEEALSAQQAFLRLLGLIAYSQPSSTVEGIKFKKGKKKRHPSFNYLLYC